MSMVQWSWAVRELEERAESSLLELGEVLLGAEGSAQQKACSDTVTDELAYLDARIGCI